MLVSPLSPLMIVCSLLLRKGSAATNVCGLKIGLYFRKFTEFYEKLTL